MFKVKHTYRVRGDHDIIETTEVIIEREEPHARISETFPGDLVGRDDLVELVLNKFINREKENKEYVKQIKFIKLPIQR